MYGRASVNDVARLSRELYTLWFRCLKIEMIAYVTGNISKLVLIFFHLKNMNTA